MQLGMSQIRAANLGKADISFPNTLPIGRPKSLPLLSGVEIITELILERAGPVIFLDRFTGIDSLSDWF